MSPPVPTLQQLSAATLIYTRKEFEYVFNIYVPIALGVFGAIVLLVLGCVLVFRRRPVERAARFYENTPVESAYALLLLLVVVFLLYITFKAEHQVDTVANAQRPWLVVNVYGAKWEWRFSYPAYGINRYSGTIDHETLVVPVNEPIRFRLISEDVIHEFWVPEVRFKHDLIPGSVQEITLSFEKRGSFPGQCAEFCGLYHSRMTFTTVAVSRSAFTAWTRYERAHSSPAAGRAAQGALAGAQQAIGSGS